MNRICVELREGRDQPSQERRRAGLYEGLGEFRLDELRMIPPICFERDYKQSMTKAKYLEYFSNFLAFQNLDDFEQWLLCFPEVSQKILKDIAINGYSVIDKYSGEYDEPLYEQTPSYRAPALAAKLFLPFVVPYRCGNLLIGVTIPVMRDVLRPYFVPPPEAQFENCRAAVPDSPVYSNETEAPRSVPLLCDAIGGEISQFEDMRTMPPISKKLTTSLRAKSGFKAFTKTDKTVPESLDLVTRFIVALTDRKPERPENGLDYIKDCVRRFFGEIRSESDSGRYCYKWDYIETRILMTHIKCKSSFWGYYDGPAPSRHIFKRILSGMSKIGGWFSAHAIAKYILYNDLEFFFIPPDSKIDFYVRASAVWLNGTLVENNNGDTEFCLREHNRFDAIITPLLCSYFYLFAALGLLEITQRKADELIIVRNTPAPYSVFDTLDAVRVTDLGRWCLGLSDERPKNPEERYEAIADKELLLVTIRGDSFERAIYLDSTGERLGENRWRISPKSFIAGCKNRKDIASRIEKFKQLIDGEPAPHWERLFEQVSSRANFLQTRQVAASVYDLGDDREFVEELLADPDLPACAFRAEGRRLVVPAKSERKFLELLARHGVLTAGGAV